MTLDAILDRLELSSPQPGAMAAFYSRAFRFESREAIDGVTHCEAPGRTLWLREGPANRLDASVLRFKTPAALRDYAARFEGAHFATFSRAADGGPLLTLRDPEQRLLHFHAKPPDAPHDALAGPRLQHYAVRSPDPEPLVDFYVGRLGFVVSDLVRRDDGALTAAFLRTDAEHHALAIFRAPEVRFDHFSCEVADWFALRDWADHMARAELPMAWGVGRHGPGNDTFFMVADPDGNLAEISSDLERCEETREAGLWPHHPSTLNRWGVAIMRS